MIFAATALTALAVLFVASDSFATAEYSERTGQGCLVCHDQPEGGSLSDRGLEFAASGYKWPPTGGYRVLGPIRKHVRLIIGLLHVTAGFLWFGTILYVHIILRPGYASKGLPKGEVALGLASMAIVGITGVLLTVSRVRSLDILFGSPWGIVLTFKIALFVIMVLSAMFVITFIGPKLKKGMKRQAEIPEGGIFDPQTLSSFDGREGRPAFIAFNGRVYDVTGKKLWDGGIHAKHLSGGDLTGALIKAPHGEEKLGGVKIVGSYDVSLKPPLHPVQKAFYFIAYMNLALVFLVLFAIAIWRWGI